MFESISEVFSSRIRLNILAALLSGDKDFTTLKKLTGASDGNLGKQMEILQNENFVQAEREWIGKRGRTTYAITTHGRSQFQAYVLLLESLLKQTKGE